MNPEIDARGLSCPHPVVETNKVLSKVGKGTVVTIVDNATARDNVARLASGRGWAVAIENKGGDYYLTMTKE